MSLLSIVEFLFATPEMRKHLKFGVENVAEDEKVYEWNQTDFNANALLYQRCVQHETPVIKETTLTPMHPRQVALVPVA